VAETGAERLSLAHKYKALFLAGDVSRTIELPGVIFLSHGFCGTLDECIPAGRVFSLASARLLLVDDDETVRLGLQSVLEAHEFEVIAVSNVYDALKHITSESFDVLLSDLHMPDAGDGLTVVSAMRHAHPNAVTIVLSAYPDMAKAVDAILKQADEVIVKPVKAGLIVEVIRQRLEQGARPVQPRSVEAIWIILEREIPSITELWLTQMESGGSLRAAPLTVEERCEHLPYAVRDIVFRLRYPHPMGSATLFSMAALQHGARRRRQGLRAATMVEEARALQEALFQTIDKNVDRMDMGKLPGTLMVIADEVNAQLQQNLSGYENEQPAEGPSSAR
jgi:DNA-binding response OmpR family regulator